MQPQPFRPVPASSIRARWADVLADLRDDAPFEPVEHAICRARSLRQRHAHFARRSASGRSARRDHAPCPASGKKRSGGTVSSSDADEATMRARSRRASASVRRISARGSQHGERGRRRPLQRALCTCRLPARARQSGPVVDLRWEWGAIAVAGLLDRHYGFEDRRCLDDLHETCSPRAHSLVVLTFEAAVPFADDAQGFSPLRQALELPAQPKAPNVAATRARYPTRGRAADTGPEPAKCRISSAPRLLQAINF